MPQRSAAPVGSIWGGGGGGGGGRYLGRWRAGPKDLIELILSYLKASK